MNGATRTRGSNIDSVDEELRDFCEQNNIDVLCLTETGRYEGEPYTVRGYTTTAMGIPSEGARSETRGGGMGVAILVSDRLATRVVKSSRHVCEPRFATVTIQSAGFFSVQNDLTVVCAYLPNNDGYAAAYSALAAYVESVNATGDSCVVAGDLNVHLDREFGDVLPSARQIRRSAQAKSKAFNKECSHINYLAVNGTRRLVGASPPFTFERGRDATTRVRSVLDYILVPAEHIDCVTACAVGGGAVTTDHRPVIATINADWGGAGTQRRTHARSLRRFRWGVLAPAGSAEAEAVDLTAYHHILNTTLVPFANKLINDVHTGRYSPMTPVCVVDDALSQLLSLLRVAAYIRVGGRVVVASVKSWWTAACTSAKRARDTARHDRDNLPPDTPAYTTAHNHYLDQRRAYQAVVRTAKRAEHERLRHILDEQPVSSREWWRPFKRRPTAFKIPPVTAGGVSATTATEAANILADDLAQRCSTIPPLTPARAAKIAAVDDTNDDGSVRESGDPRVDCEVSFGEVQLILQDAKLGKAVGIDNFPVELLAVPKTDDAHDTHAGVITGVQALFELIRVTHKVPTMFKTSVVTCLFKGRPKDPRDPASYRPISVSTALSKLHGTLLLQRMFTTVDSKLHHFCCGSRKGRDIQELVLLTQLMLNSESGTAAGVLFADVRAAYDTCDRTEILYSLRNAGVGGWVFRTIKDALTGTTARVKVNGQLSREVPILNGLPQGSVYGPLCFNIMFTGVMDCMDSLGPHTPHFVPQHINDVTTGYRDAGRIPGAVAVSTATVLDDVALFLSTDAATRRLQLQKLHEFLTDICMSLNPDKSQLLSRDTNVLPSIVIGGKRVVATRKATYLGVDITLYGDRRNKKGRLLWTPDGARMHASLRAAMFPFRYDSGLRRNALSIPLAIDVYRGQVLNAATYGAAVTVLTNKSALQRLDRYVARGLADILGTSWISDPTLVLAQVGILPTELLHGERRLRFLYKLANASGGWMQSAFKHRTVLSSTPHTWMAAVRELYVRLDLRDADGYTWPRLHESIGPVAVPPGEPHPPSWKSAIHEAIGYLADEQFTCYCDRHPNKAYIARHCYTPLSLRPTVWREPYLAVAPKHIARLLLSLRTCSSNLAYDASLFNSKLKPECTLCNSGEYETVPHFLFDCTALTDERVPLERAVVAALTALVDTSVPGAVAMVLDAYTHLSGPRRAAVVFGATVRDWIGYRADRVMNRGLTPAGSQFRNMRAPQLARLRARECGENCKRLKPAFALNWQHTADYHNPNAPPFTFELSAAELEAFGKLVWPHVHALWRHRTNLLRQRATAANP